MEPFLKGDFGFEDGVELDGAETNNGDGFDIDVGAFDFTFDNGDVAAANGSAADAGGCTFGGGAETVSFGSFGGDAAVDGGFSFGATDASADAGGFTFDASSFSEPVQDGYCFPRVLLCL